MEEVSGYLTLLKTMEHGSNKFTKYVCGIQRQEHKLEGMRITRQIIESIFNDEENDSDDDWWV